MRLFDRRQRARSRGQALVEFALVIPLFLLLLVGLFDLGRAVFAYNTLTNAAREGARIAIVNQYKPSIIQRAKDQTAIVELNDPSVSISFYQVKSDGTPDTSKQCALVAVGCLAVVSFEATYRPITPFISNIIFGSGVTFEAESVLSVEFELSAGSDRRRGRRELPETAMNHHPSQATTSEVTMSTPTSALNRSRRGSRGQIIVIATLAMVAMIGGVSLVVEAGNAYAHQREVQNAADALANAGATVLAQKLGGDTKTDADVAAAISTLSTANRLSSNTAYYTDVAGDLIRSDGTAASGTGNAARVGDGVLPPGAQGVQAGGSQGFGTTFARVLGINQFTASADATAVTGALSGGQFLPVVFPVNIVECEKNGDLGTGEANWTLSEPDPAGGTPIGQEYIVPLCKTGGGSFMILDLDGNPNNCDDEVTNPPAIQFDAFPADVQSDNGNNCAKKMVDEVNALSGEVVLIPICDGECVTGNGSNAVYHIIKVTAFYLDYMSDQNGGNNTQCQGNGTTLVPIRGNGSSSCLAGWFVRYITSGPVGAGPITGAGAIGVQLVK